VEKLENVLRISTVMGSGKIKKWKICIQVENTHLVKNMRLQEQMFLEC
jgi:hypothetical protein